MFRHMDEGNGPLSTPTPRTDAAPACTKEMACGRIVRDAELQRLDGVASSL